jgi:two-component system LytT family response regulator
LFPSNRAALAWALLFVISRRQTETMSKHRVLIVDDEPLARERVRAFLRTDPNVDIVGECGDGPGALAAIQAEQPDIVFLDVQIPGCDGFEVLAKLPAAGRPAVVLMTAHARFAVDATTGDVADFLLKPFDLERFHVALARAMDRVN